MTMAKFNAVIDLGVIFTADSEDETDTALKAIIDRLIEVAVQSNQFDITIEVRQVDHVED
jgi:hypothetical protein